MRPDRRERGFALVAAMFVMIVIAMAIAAMLRLSVTQTATVDLALQQARAYQAARAGLEWGVNRAMRDQPCSGSLALEGFAVAVVCSATPGPDLPEEGRSGVLFHRIEATAQFGQVGSPDYAWRQLEVVVEK